MREFALVLLFVATGLAYKHPHKDNNPCKDVPIWNQNVLLPYPNDCGSYIQCTNQQPVVRTCPSGLHWNQLSKRCDWPQVAKCNATNGHAEEEETDSKVKWPSCKNVTVAHEVFYPHPTNCSLFIHCFFTEPVVMECPSGLHWNNATNMCDFPWIAKCNASTIFGANKTRDCSKVSENQNVLFPNPEDCSTFYQCVHQKPQLMVCPDGLHFSALTNRCEHPSNARCEAVRISLQQILVVAASQRGCEGVPETIDVLLPNPDDCGSYIQCVHQNPMIRNCPAGLHFSVKYNRCEWPEIAQCVGRNSCENVPETQDVLLPNPSDCGTYYQCVHQKPVLRYCPIGLHWSIANNRCEWPSIAHCEEKNIPSRIRV